MSMNDDIDVQEIRVTPFSPLPKMPAPNRRRSNRGGWIYQPKPGEKFLRGPIPWLWLQCAGKGKGKTLHVAVALWHQAAFFKAITFGFNQSRMSEMGVTRDSARRGLRELERLKLVSAKRRDGRKPIVTILLKGKTLKRATKDNGNGKESDMSGATE